RISDSGRPRWCSRITYWAMRSSVCDPERKKENAPASASLIPIGRRLYSRSVKGPATAGRFAERFVDGRDDGGSPERVLIWIERPVDPCLELLRDDVLQAVRFVVHVVDVHAQRLREVELEQPVVADDLDRDALTGRCQRRAAVLLMLEQLQRGKLLDHRRRRR